MRVGCWGHSWVATTDRLPVRGFGPGLPPEGAALTARPDGEVLRIEDWPGIERVRRSELSMRKQGEGLVLEWQSPEGPCALTLDMRTAAAWKDWLPGHTRPQADHATRRWLWGALSLAIGLPLLLLALFFAFRSQILDAAVAQISIAQEQKLGDQLWRMQGAQIKRIENTAANRFIEETGARLIKAKPSPYRYHFYIADDAVINAYAMPGGYIVVNRSLIEKADSAEEVAGVLAHEIEHVEQRHSLRGMAQQFGLALIAAAVTGDIGGGAAASWLKELAGLQFSREQESAADSGGYARLIAAQVDPHGMASFFEKLEKESASMPGALALLSTHPASAERAEAIKAKLQAASAFAPMDVKWADVKASIARK